MSAEEEGASEGSPYAGRWVARLGGRIIAHGGTPEQARLAAQRSRYKEKAEVSYMQPASPLALSPLVERVRAVLPDLEIYLVGGAVRDALIGKVSHDLDFAVPDGAILVARRVAEALDADFYILDETFDTARVIVRTNQGADAVESGSSREPRITRDFLDFSAFRATKVESQRKKADIERDLRGRDFTINAMAYDLHAGSILDPLNGASDLRTKVVRTASANALEDDAIRIMRGVRLAAALQFKIDPATRKAMKTAARLLPTISPERQRDELFKMLEGRRPDASLRALEMLGVFPYIMPELSAMKGVQQSAPHVMDVWNHTLSVIQYLEGILTALDVAYPAESNNDLLTGLLSLRLGRYRDQFARHFALHLNPDRSLRALLFFAALYHDVSKPDTKTVEETGRTRFFGHESDGAEKAASRARAFNLSNDEVDRLRTIVAHHMRFHLHVSRFVDTGRLPSRRSVYRFFRDAGNAGVDLILLGMADMRGTRGHLLTQDMWDGGLEVARAFLENYWEKPQESIKPPRLLDGHDLMNALAIEPGRIVGELLEAIREAQASGEVSSRDEALTFAREWLSLRDNRN